VFEGGYDAVNEQNMWDAIGSSLGFKEKVGDALHAAFKKILYPFELFESGKALNHLVSEFVTDNSVSIFSTSSEKSFFFLYPSNSRT
jgi:hypothetical protein